MIQVIVHCFLQPTLYSIQHFRFSLALLYFMYIQSNWWMVNHIEVTFVSIRVVWSGRASMRRFTLNYVILTPMYHVVVLLSPSPSCLLFLMIRNVQKYNSNTWWCIFSSWYVVVYIFRWSIDNKYVLVFSYLNYVSCNHEITSFHLRDIDLLLSYLFTIWNESVLRRNGIINIVNVAIWYIMTITVIWNIIISEVNILIFYPNPFSRR